MQKYALLLTLALITASWTTESRAQEAAPVPAPPAQPPIGKVRVVTRNVEPFSFEQNGRRVGFAMELWDQVARQADLSYEVRVVGTAQEMIDALADKSADAAVGAISVTSKREAIIDFSQPFYEAGLQIMVAGSGGGVADSLWSLVAGLLNWKVIGMFAVLIFAMLVISHLVWMYEHKVNGEMWPESYRHGMWESFWWTISTLLVGGADNKGPVGVGGRIIAIIWMLLSIVLVSLLTASFTTTLTVSSLKNGISGPADIPGKKVATIGKTVSETWLNSHGAQVKLFATIAECIQAVKKGEVEAVVYDAPLLQYAMTKANDAELQLVGPVFDRQNYAIGLQQDSPIRERINQALLALYEGGIRDELRKRWFGEEE